MDHSHHRCGCYALVLALILAALAAAAPEDIAVQPTARPEADRVDLQARSAEAIRVDRIPFDCDVRQPTPGDVAAAQAAERAMYNGKTVAELGNQEVAVAAVTCYTLVNVPVRFHILQNSVVNTARVNEVMLLHMVDALNLDYAGFATFVYNGTVVQSTSNNCDNLVLADYNALVNATREVNTTYKLHAIICELADYSGIASFPTDYQLPITNYQMALSKQGAGGGSATHKEPT